MERFFSASVFGAVWMLGGAHAFAEDKTHDSLIKALLTDLPAESVPAGYKFLIVEGIAIGDAPIEKKIQGAGHALFERSGRLPGKPEFDGGYEIFYYFVLPSAQDAVEYEKTELVPMDHSLWAADDAILRTDGTKTVSDVNAKLPGGETLKLRCETVDYAIGCHWVDGPVAVEVGLQEPKLRDAKTDAERQHMIAARVQSEAKNGLINAAFEHLARAKKA
jgi:hypothetical protein